MKTLVRKKSYMESIHRGLFFVLSPVTKLLSELMHVKHYTTDKLKHITHVRDQVDEKFIEVKKPSTRNPILRKDAWQLSILVNINYKEACWGWAHLVSRRIPLVERVFPYCTNHK
jgi:hypothetical protein